jgi:mevalonate kinase
MGEIEKSTYKELLKDMNKVQKWLKSIGIETENTRFEKAKNKCMEI